MEIPAIVLGIASNGKIWKLCWKINQELEIHLSTGDPQVSTLNDRGVYTSIEEDSAFEFTLFDKKLISARKIPKNLKEFRYYFVVRPLGEREPDAGIFLQALNRIDIISVAVDLTEVQDIKNILP